MWIAAGALALSSLFAALPGAAARLGVDASAETIRPGEPLVITVTGDSQGTPSGFMEALLHFSGSIIPSDAEPPFILNSSDTFGMYWAADPPTHGRCGLAGDPADSCRAATAFAGPIFEASIDLLPSTLSVFAFDTAGAAPGSVLIFQAIELAPGSFFGAPPSSVVSVSVIPEPATALLASLGLAALAGGCRAREEIRSRTAARRRCDPRRPSPSAPCPP